MAGPCNWELSEVPCSCGCEDHPPVVQQLGEDYATTVLWAITGRRYGLCEVTVRPCGRRKGTKMPSWGWGAWWDGGLWMPYVGSDGLWRNCGCHAWCNCTARCEAYLPGPVNSVTEVVVDQEVVPSSAYEVHDGHWLVRVDDGCWPQCPSMDTSDAFEVTYVRGEPVPAALAGAARTLACEFMKACNGDACRLPGRTILVARQGTTVQNVDPDRLLMNGLTGVAEVDQIVVALNPHGLKERPRLWSPDLPRPRQVTTPAGP